MSFWLKTTLVSGDITSGRKGVKGLMRSRNRTKGYQSQRIPDIRLNHRSFQIKLTAAHLEAGAADADLEAAIGTN